MSAPKFGLDDAAVGRVADRLASKVAEPTAAEPVPELRFASYEAAMQDLRSGRFERIGSAMYKKGHSLWQLSKTSDGYALVRVASEPAVFEEDETKEAPGMHSEEHLKMGSRDRYGVQVRAGDFVHYSLGGEPVVGRVVRAAYGYLDVRLDGQMDSGVPSDMVMVDRRRRAGAHGEDPSIGIERDSPMHETDKSDKEQMGMHVNPEKAASFIGQHFGSFGAMLSDEIDQSLPRAVVAKINRLAQEAKSCENCQGKGCEQCMGRQAVRVASWSSLQQFGSKDVLRGILDNVKAGMTARRASKAANIPFALAYALRDDLKPIPPNEVREIFRMAKNVRTATLDDTAFGNLAGKVGSEFAQHLVSHVQAFRTGSLAFQRTAVDQTAEDYWKAYFGDYGDQWVREIKRRVKADLVRVALVKQGVDETAAEYWSNYYGDYGDKLVEEVDRASKKKEVTAARHRPMNAGAPEMPLPQPVARRDIFAGQNIIAEESWDTNRVALVKTASGAFQVLVRSGNAQKIETPGSQHEAITAFRKAVYAHCGI